MKAISQIYLPKREDPPRPFDVGVCLGVPPPRGLTEREIFLNSYRF